MTKVFIDGSEGTTGLRIRERLEGRSDIQLLQIDPELRKDTAARRELLNAADVAILCLPDAAAVEAVSLVDNPNTVVLDASTAHRTAPGWQYGFAELGKEFRQGIAAGKRVANPGCHASGFLALARPLVQCGLMPADYPAVCHSLTGYSGGGKKMIAQYQDENRDGLLQSPRQYGLSQSHKHQPEMQVYSGLDYVPVFNPIVADFYAGMEVSLPLIGRLLTRSATPDDVRNIYKEFYSGCKLVQVAEADDQRYLQGGFAAASVLAGSDGMVICVTGSADRIQVMALFDNLGKGASGAAVQNLNIIMGADEATGLVPLP